MIYKIQQYLLRHYPLIWNTRVVFVLPIAFAIHLLFFFLGHLRNINFTTVYYKVYITPPEVIYVFSFLFSLVFIVVWLSYFLRNNAFKNKLFYTWKKLVAEWFITTFILVFSSSFFLSYQYGYFLNYQKEIAKIDIQKELEVYYMGCLLLPIDLDPFYYRNTCDALKERDGKVVYSRDALDNNIYSYDFTIPYDDSANLLCNGEPVLSYLYPCFAYDILKESRDASLSEETIAYEATISTNYKEANRSVFLPEKDFLVIKNKVRQLLLAEDQDSLAIIIKNYLNLIQKYGGNSRLDVYAHVLGIFSEPKFAVKSVIPTTQYSYTEDRERRHNNYVEENVGTVLSVLLAFQKTGKWFSGYVSPLLYLAYYLSLLLFLFRLSSLRVWLYALLGLGIILLMYFLFAIVVNNEPFWFIIFATVIYLLIAALGIQSKTHKTASGLFLHWFIIQQPIIWFMLYFSIFDRYNVNDMESVARHNWIEKNLDMLNNYNLLFSVIILLFIALPLWRRWQSNPEA